MADYPEGSTQSKFVGNILLGVRSDTPADRAGTNAYCGAPQLDSYGNLRVTMEGGAPTYTATSQFASDSTATDIAYVAGSTLCVAKILKIVIGTVATAAAAGDISIYRRSAVNTAGTAVAAAIGKLDTRNAAPNLAPNHYTAHPSALGAGVVFAAEKIVQQAAASAQATRVTFDFTGLYGSQGFRIGASVTDIIAINVPAALGASGNLWTITWTWVELPLTA